MTHMSSTVAEEFAASLNLIRDRFTEGLPKSVESLDNLSTQIEQSKAPVAAMTEAAREMHRIAGVSSTLGFPGLGDSAKKAETCLHLAIETPEDSGLILQAIELVDEAVDFMSDVITKHSVEN